MYSMYIHEIIQVNMINHDIYKSISFPSYPYHVRSYQIIAYHTISYISFDCMFYYFTITIYYLLSMPIYAMPGHVMLCYIIYIFHFITFFYFVSFF